MRRLTLVLSLAAILCLSTGLAAQQHVLHVPGDYTTIQGAIDAAGSIISPRSG